MGDAAIGSPVSFNNRDIVKYCLTPIPACTREPDDGHQVAAYATSPPHM